MAVVTSHYSRIHKPLSPVRLSCVCVCVCVWFLKAVYLDKTFLHPRKKRCRSCKLFILFHILFVVRQTDRHVGFMTRVRKILRKPSTSRQKKEQKQACVFACRYVILNVQACSNQIIFLPASQTQNRGSVNVTRFIWLCLIQIRV